MKVDAPPVSPVWKKRMLAEIVTPPARIAEKRDPVPHSLEDIRGCGKVPLTDEDVHVGDRPFEHILA
jgi:hypothetical protein